MKQFLEFSRTSSELQLTSIKPRDQKYVGSIRKSRRQLESDAVSLANRIFILQREEAKLVKNVEVANAKTQELYIMKKREAERSQEVKSINRKCTYTF